MPNRDVRVQVLMVEACGAHRLPKHILEAPCHRTLQLVPRAHAWGGVAIARDALRGHSKIRNVLSCR
jgi:hypothetical protein